METKPQKITERKITVRRIKEPKITVKKIVEPPIPNINPKIIITKIDDEPSTEGLLLEKKKLTKEQNKLYYENFKTKHQGIIKKQFSCELCGGKFTYYNKTKHTTSKKHMEKVSK